MTSVYLLQMLAPYWIRSNWCLVSLNHLIEKSGKKCYFFQASVIFLGHVLSADGISANPEKVDKVQDWLVPKNAKELHSFLGLASYYCQFIPNFAHVAKCLHQFIGQTNVKKTKAKKVRKEAITLDQKKIRVDTTNICLGVWTSEGFWCTKISFNYSPSAGIPQF